MNIARTTGLLCATLGLLVSLTQSVRAAARTLEPAWTFPTTGTIAPVDSSPTVFAGVVYAGSDDGRLYAIHATGPKAGTLVPGFPIQLDGAIKGRPAIYGDRSNERIYVATSNGSLYCFTLDGVPVWRPNPVPVCPGVPILSTPAVRGPYVYVTTSDGRVLRRSATDGRASGGLTYGRTVLTRLPTPQRVPPDQTYLEVDDARGLFGAGRVTVVTNDALGERVTAEYTYAGKNTAVTPNRLLNVAPVGNGSPLLSHPKGSVVVGFGPGAACNASPAVPGTDNATLVIAAVDGNTPATRFSPADRNLVGLKSEPFGLVPQWEMAYGARITTAPTVDENTGRLYVGSRESATDPTRGGRLYCLMASNGLPDPAWPNDGYLPVPDGVLEAGPWLDRTAGRLYYGTTDGRLYGVDAGSGRALFPPSRLDDAAGSFLATPLALGGRLYIGSHTGRFYSVSVQDPSEFRVYADPDGAPIDTSPSASGSTPGRDVVVVGSSSGRVLAFPVE